MDAVRDRDSRNLGLIFERLSVRFEEKLVLKDIDAALERGVINVAVGPSGSGKTTLLRAVNRLNETFSGCRTAGGVHIRFSREWAQVYDSSVSLPQLRRKVGMVFQHPNVLPFSIRKNFTLPLSITLSMDRRSMEERMEKVLRDVWLWDEVKDRLGDSAHSLSGGQQQRLCFARALALEPEVLLLDEPTASLDFKATRKIEALILSLKTHYTIVAVTHSLGQMRRLADRVLVLNEGRLIHDLSRPQLEDSSAFGVFLEDIF